MKVCDFLVNSLINRGVTDVFGIPGCVVLDFLYALKRRDKEISAHLNFHEQASAFAAVGYAQVNTTLGCAYATRGPGLTNMITAIADAYYSFTFESGINNPYLVRRNLNTALSMDQCTISIDSKVADLLKLRGDRSQNTIDYLYCMVGHCIRHMVMGNNTVSKNVQRLNANYVLKNYGYDSWPYCIEILEKFFNFLGIFSPGVQEMFYFMHFAGELPNF